MLINKQLEKNAGSLLRLNLVVLKATYFTIYAILMEKCETISLVYLNKL